MFGTALACAGIGFADDWLKIVKARSLGLSARTKLACQLVIAIGLWAVATRGRRPQRHDAGSASSTAQVDIGGFYVVLIFLVLAGATNGVNLDGRPRRAGRRLCGDRAAHLHRDGVHHRRAGGPHRSSSRTACRCSARASWGRAIGFLWFNSFPAAIFMGDTGSLGLGGAIAGMAVMTKSEVLLIVIGGIFVIEALSVAAQVLHVSRVSPAHPLDGADPPPLRAAGLVGDQDHRAVLDHGCDRERDRLHALPAEHRRIAVEGTGRAAGPRPALLRRPLPGRGHGPLRRGGGAGAAGGPTRRPRGRLRRRHRPPRPPRRGKGLRGRASKSTWITDGTQLLAGSEAPRTLVKSPGVPDRRARRGGSTPTGHRDRGRARARLAAAAERVRGGDGHERQDDHGRADRRRSTGPRACPSRSPATSAPRSASLVGHLDPDATVVCEASSFQLEDSVAFAPEVGAVPQLLRRTTSTATRTVARYLAAKLRIFANQRQSDIAVLNASEPALSGRRPGARPAGLVRRGPRLRPVPREQRAPLARRAADRRVRLAAAGPAQRPGRDGAPPRPRSPTASSPRRSAGGCASSRACRTAWSWCGSSAACAT